MAFVLLAACRLSVAAGSPDPAALIHVLVSLQASSPTIGCAPVPLEVFCLEGGPVSLSSLRVWNVTPVSTLDYILASTPTRIICIPTSGSSTGEITTHTVSVDPLGLNAGDYPGTITITAAGATNSPLRVPVAIHVQNTLPTANIISMAPNPVAAGATVTLTLAGQDNTEPSQSLTDGQVTWPDGVHAGILPGVHRLAAPRNGGNYTIQYRVRDDEGTWSAASTRTLVVLSVTPPVLVPEPAFTKGTTNTVFWNGTDMAGGSYLEWSTNSSFSAVTGNSGWTAAATYLVTGLLDGRTYYYRVKCRNASLAESAWSNTASSTQDASGPAAPGRPSDPGQYTSTTLVRFIWTAATDPGITPSGVVSCHLQVGTGPGRSDVFDANVGNVLVRTVSGSSGQRLYARVRALDAVGNIGAWSGNSDGILIDTTGPTAPGRPMDIGDYTSSPLVTFTWTGATDPGTTPSGVLSYDFQVGTTVPIVGPIRNVGLVISYGVTGSNGQRLYARVRARDRAGNAGPWSLSSDGITIDTVPPGLVGAAPLDYSAADVTFSEAVINADQEYNYTFAPALGIQAVQPLSDAIFRLYTNPQVPGTTYTVTVKNAVQDRAGNPIDSNRNSRSFRAGAKTSVPTWEHYR
jgi:hypothetical protein